MMRKVCGGLLWLLMACDEAHTEEAASDRALFELSDTTHDAFSSPMPGLDERGRTRFFVGNSFFNQNWVSAPSSVETRDGLGPLFNARSCSSCHFKDGRGRAPDGAEPLQTMLVRISTPGSAPHEPPRPDPRYGDQLQGEALAGLAREARVSLHYREVRGSYADGDPYVLRAPELIIDELGYGALPEDLQTSARVAPALVGLGLLEAVPERELLARADAEDRDGDGISGRANRVHSVANGARQIGRFGWKAEQATLPDQIAAAFVADMGITSTLFPRENHTELEADCEVHPSGGYPELPDSIFDDVVTYARTLAVPARRELDPALQQLGGLLFERARCASCHVPTLTTARHVQPSVLASRTIHPYTDLLLHDLGEALSDGRPSFAAAGAEWRTAPLWGLGLVEHVNGGISFLHDGRARTFAEAVLWHGGEAEASKQAFVHMSRAERRALVRFLESL